jgi:ADP-ribose pyrophosphatase YjhB (NUDIX family)
MKRALPPQKGHWAIPAGFMEQGENLRQAAARELWEETCVKVDPEQLTIYMMGTISFISEVYVAFHAEVDSTDCCCGDESLDVGFFSRDELPWDEVAYPQANNSIEQAYADIARGKFGVYHAQMTAELNELIEVPALIS